MIKMITDIKRRGSFLHCPLPGLTWKVSFCTWCFWKATWLPTAKREKTYKLSSVMKKTAPHYRGALVPARLFPIRRIFHIWGSERTGAVLWQPTPRPEKWYAKCTECICMNAEHFLPCVWPGIWHSRGFQMGFKTHPQCLYKAIVCELATLYLSRKTSFIGPEVPQVA